MNQFNVMRWILLLEFFLMCQGGLLGVGIVTGNPQISQRNPYPYPWKPVPVDTGMGRVRVYPWVSYLNPYIILIILK